MYVTDDGTQDATMTLDYTDDTAIKTIALPAGALTGAGAANLWVRGQATDCRSSGNSHRLTANANIVGDFNPCGAWPSTFKAYRHDDGSKELEVKVDGLDDVAVKHLKLDSDSLSAMSSARLWFYAKATDCAGAAENTMVLLLNGHNVFASILPGGRFDPCTIWSSAVFEWKHLNLLPLIDDTWLEPSGRNILEFRKVAGAATSRTVTFGVDTSDAKGLSRAEQDGELRVGELMWYLEITRSGLEWRLAPIPLGFLNAGANNVFEIEELTADPSDQNIVFAMDTSSGSAWSTAVQNGATVAGELMWKLDVIPAGATNAYPTISCITPTYGANRFVSFSTAGCASDGNGDALTYQWYWGDGTAAGSGASPSHTFPCKGPYTVVVFVQDPHGGWVNGHLVVTPTETQDADGDGLVKCLEDRQGTSDAAGSVDTDLDGIRDNREHWSHAQYNATFCDAPVDRCAFPNPAERDLYYEVDWYTGRPFLQGAVTRVVRAFGASGLSPPLHVTIDRGQFGGGGTGLGPGGNVDFDDGADNYAVNLAAARQGVFHYVVNACEDPTDPPGVTTFGVGETPGDVVVLYDCTLDPGTMAEDQAKELMHEGGHNILGHRMLLPDCNPFIALRNPTLNHFSHANGSSNCDADAATEAWSHSTNANDDMIPGGPDAKNLVDYHDDTWADIKLDWAFSAPGPNPDCAYDAPLQDLPLGCETLKELLYPRHGVSTWEWLTYICGRAPDTVAYDPRAPCKEWNVRTPWAGSEGEAAAAWVGPLFVASHGRRASAPSSAAAAYDPVSDAWVDLPPAPTARVGAFGARGLAFGPLGTPTYLVLGGSGSCGSPCATVDIYDPVARAWSEGASMPVPVHGAAFVSDGRLVYAVGGRACAQPYCGSALSIVQVYDSATDAWILGPPLPSPRSDAAAALESCRLYLAGGNAGGDDLAAVAVLDTCLGTWMAPAAPLPTARSGAHAASCAGRVFVIGGQHGNGDPNGVVEQYDPVADTWETYTPMPRFLPDAARGSLVAPSAVDDSGAMEFVAGADHYRMTCTAP